MEQNSNSNSKSKNADAVVDTSVFDCTITAARWNRAETAFYKHATITKVGTVLNLRTAILAAIRELFSC